MPEKSLSKELLETIFNSPLVKGLKPEDRKKSPANTSSLSVKDAADFVKRAKKGDTGVIEGVEDNYDAIAILGEDISGYLDKIALRENLNNIQSVSDILKEYFESREAFNFAAERGFIENELNNLLRYITQVKEFGGRYGIFQAAPGIALWVQTYARLQPLRPEEARVSVEDTGFYKKNMGVIEKLFAINKRAAERNHEKWEAMPRAMKVFSFEGDKFNKVGVTYYKQYSCEEGRANLFSLRPLKTDQSKVALVSTTTCDNPTGVIPPGKDAPRLPEGGWRWALVKNSPSYFWEDNPHVKKVYEAWKSLEKNYYIIKQSFDCFKEAEYWDEIIRGKCADKPQEWEKAEIFSASRQLKVEQLLIADGYLPNGPRHPEADQNE